MDIRFLIEITTNNILEDCIAVFCSGSYYYPFIKHVHDIDIFFIVKERKTQPEYYNLFLKHGIDIRELHSQQKIDLHFVSLESVNNRLYIWQNKYIKFIYNPNNIYLEDDVFKNQERIIKVFKNNLKTLYQKDLIWKEWYYIYITLCFLKNKDYVLTEEQITNINILHDRKRDKLELNFRLKEEIIKEIELWPK